MCSIWDTRMNSKSVFSTEVSFIRYLRLMILLEGGGREGGGGGRSGGIGKRGER